MATSITCTTPTARRGQLDEDDLGKAKAAVYQRRYDNFRHNLKLEQKYIDSSSAADLDGVTFAFVCVDKGSARAEIFDLLIRLGIPFIDVGMGLNRKERAARRAPFARPVIRPTKRPNPRHGVGGAGRPPGRRLSGSSPDIRVERH